MKTLVVEIDLICKCNLRCPTCPMGRGEMRNTQPLIQPTDLERWLRLLSKQRRINLINLYWFGEPFLHPQLPELVSICKRYSPFVYVPTNAQVRDRVNLADYAKDEPQCTMVSVSGWRQETHARHYVGADIEKCKDFVRRCHDLRMRHVFINYHVYRDSVAELRDWQRFARPFGYPVLPRFPAWLSLGEQMRGDRFDGYWLTAEEVKHYAKPGRECNTMDCMVCVSPTGEFYHCQQVADLSVPRLGHVETTSVDDHIARRRQSGLCAACIKSGAAYMVNHHYIAPDFKQIWRAGRFNPSLWMIPVRRLAWLNHIGFKNTLGKLFKL